VNAGRASTGLVRAVLCEVTALLDILVATPEATTTLDLRSLPMSDADRAELHDCLGTGEVRATLELAGATHIHETAFAGVWWVRHEAPGGGVLAEQLVVAAVPDLLRAHPADVAAARHRLGAIVAADVASSPAVEMIDD
jgi:hydrogenase-1 operon protein HyaF